MARTKIVWHGKMPSVHVELPDADLTFDPADGFSKLAPGVLALHLLALPKSFGAHNPPTHARVLVFDPASVTLPDPLALTDLEALEPVAVGVEPVTGPGELTVKVEGLAPGKEYDFVILSDYAE